MLHGTVLDRAILANINAAFEKSIQVGGWESILDVLTQPTFVL